MPVGVAFLFKPSRFPFCLTTIKSPSRTMLPVSEMSRSSKPSNSKVRFSGLVFKVGMVLQSDFFKLVIDSFSGHENQALVPGRGESACIRNRMVVVVVRGQDALFVHVSPRV